MRAISSQLPAAALWLLLLIVTSRGGGAKSHTPPPCTARIGDGHWLASGEAPESGAVVAVSGASPGSEAPDTWAWSPAAVSTCSVAPLSRRALSLLLHNKWVAVLGDSVARLFCAALLRLGGEHSVEQPVLDRHRSFEYRLAARGSHLSFVWAPYAENITAALASWRQDGHVPDVIVMGSSLWHMLHVRNVTHYAASLAGIRVTLDALLASERRMPIAPFWMTTTALVGHKLNTPEKQAHLTPGHVDAYDAAAAALLAPAAGGPCIVLDVHQVTAACGESCTDDGMHFHNATFDLLVQQWANELRFHRRTALCSMPRRAAVNESLVAQICADLVMPE